MSQRSSLVALTLLAGASRALEDMLTAIERAERRVWIETYIIRHDQIGTRLARALIDARARGVDVRLLFDAVGSHDVSREYLERLRQNGIDARRYRPVIRQLPAIFPRDHVRNMIVDDAGFTGGSAWGDEWLPSHEGGRGWHDVCVRVAGAAIGALEWLFEARWARSGQRRLPPASSIVIDAGEVSVLSEVARGARCILEAHVTAVRRAKRRIWIENAYFFAPRVLLDALFDAVRRGVDVRLLLPSETDLPVLTRAARGEYARWIGAGLRVFEYTPAVLHAKVAVIDDDWCTVGTFNINPASVACAHELNVVVRDRSFVALLARRIERDLNESKLVRLEDVARWPIIVRIGRRLAALAFRVIELALERRFPRFLWADAGAFKHTRASAAVARRRHVTSLA